MSKNGALPTKKRKAIEALVSSGNISKAAAAAGCGRSTLYRWLSEDSFRAALGEAEALALAALSRRLAALADTAVSTLEKAMSNPKATPSARVRAADIVLARLLQLRELAIVEERLGRLEAELATLAAPRTVRPWERQDG